MKNILATVALLFGLAIAFGVAITHLIIILNWRD